MLAPPKQRSFLTISNENIFSKTQGGRLGAKVAPNKGLELALPAYNVSGVEMGPEFFLYHFTLPVLILRNVIKWSYTL